MPRGIPLRSCSFATCQVAPAPLPFWIFFLGNHHFLGRIMVEWQDSTMKIMSHIDLQNRWIFHDFSWNGKAGKAPLPILWMALWQRHLHSVWCASHHSWKRWCPHGDCPMCHFLDRNCWSMLIWTPIFVQKIGSIDWFLPIQKAHESSIFPGLHSGSCQPQMKPWLVEYFCAGGCAVLFLETITTYIRGRIRASHSRFSLIHPTLSTIAMFDNFEILRNLSIQQENTHPLTIGVFFSEVLPWFELPSGYVKIAIENGHL